MTPEPKGIEVQFKHSLCMLAADGKLALASLPEDCVRSEELALDFDNWARAFVANFGEKLPRGQLDAIVRITDLLDAMSDGSTPEVWTDESVVTGRAWEEVRSAAARAAELLGWDC